MKKYIINIVSSRFKNDPIGGGASAKAPADILALAKDAGYVEIDVYTYISYGKVRQLLNLLWQFLKLSGTLEKDSIVFFQYPHINPRIMPIVMPLFKKYRKAAIIHDMNSIRVDGNLSNTEKKALNYFDELYVHSDNMQGYLKTKLKQDIVYHVIECFPYMAAPNLEKRSLSNQVVFAGNLDKSYFLLDFVKSNKNLDLLLYGIMKDSSKLSGKANYMGKFQPDEIQNIKGSWGLVWDGERTDCCGGSYGEYLKIIAPHKFSMYLAAELPVIVWKESAMAKLVEKYQLGITIGSLSEISDKIETIDENIYQSFLDNIRSYLNNNMNVVFSL